MFRQTVRKQLLGSLAVIFIAACINVSVDPYGLFGFDFKSVNHYKYNETERMSKYYYLKRIRPEVVLMGTSRADILNQNILSNYIGKRTVYNASLSGSTIIEQTSYIKFCIDKLGTNVVFYGLDYHSFLGDGTQADFSLERLNGNNYYKADFIQTIFSLSALYNSGRTVLTNILGRPSNQDYQTGQMFIRNANSEVDIVSKIKTIKEPVIDKKIVDKNIQLLDKLVRLCDEKKVKLVLFIMPTPSGNFIKTYGRKNFESYIYWLKRITEIRAIYDFNYPNSVNSNYNLFYDDSHIQKESSKQIFARMLDDKNISVPTDFGVFVTKENINEHVAFLNEQIKQWEISHSKEVAEILETKRKR